MIQKYYNGILEQIYNRIGKEEHNVALAKYSNDFSVDRLALPQHITACEGVYFTSCEFASGDLAGPYEPFLSLIKDMFEQYETLALDDFMEKCKVYGLHRQIIRSYIVTGRCRRDEQLLYNETSYEQERMTEAILTMMIELSKIKPFLILINRLQLAARSTMILLTKLLLAEDVKNIGVVLGMNELQHFPEFIIPVWENLTEELEDQNAVFRIGSAGGTEIERPKEDVSDEHFLAELEILWNLFFMLDLEQALFCLERLNRRLKFENFTMTDAKKFEIWHLYAYVCIYTGDLSKALEISEDIKRLVIPDNGTRPLFDAYYIMATAYMYQGKLKESIESARIAQKFARQSGQKKQLFQAELIEVQAKMSGWNNIFFCAQNVEISDQMIEKLLQYNYRDHLAYIYIYAYDNKPEIVAKAYRSEAQLIYFSKGIKLAKEIGNEQLIYNAYQKNIMLASTNGMHEIAMLYSVRTFEDLSNKKSLECGRIYSGIGYNLSALGENELAKKYYQKAVQLFFELDLPEDIAEVYYNMALNCIGLNEFREANEYLMRCMKAIERLRLNSLRVCNLSKLYGLLALCNRKIGNRFNCEQYLNNCKQFLNYIFEKENSNNDISNLHDYANCDNDMFLYYFSLGLLQMQEGDMDGAYESFGTAESHLIHAEGNQFFCYRLFRKSRIKLYEATGRMELKENEEAVLSQYEEMKRRISVSDELKVLEPVEEHLKKEPIRVVTTHELEMQLRQESINRAYRQEKRQLDFISTWQKLIDVTDRSAEVMMEQVMRTFLYHFNVDRALYIEYRNREPRLIYDNTETKINEETQNYLKKIFEKSGRGFAVSKISSNYAEHLNVIQIFGEDRVCSMVAIPFFDNNTVTSIMIAYVLMKDNWHSSVNRYMLDESDLSIYELLFREVQYSLNRLYAYEKIYEMNTKLYQSAVTDQLTGILNRKGFYQNIASIIESVKQEKINKQFGVMFIDLDNFKGYNDNFGHDIGDLLLKSMAQIFEKVCGERGFVTRYGGDEFIIFTYTDDKAVLEEMAKTIYREIGIHNGFKEEIRQEIGKSVEIADDKLISCSIGIITSHEVNKEEDINNMIKRADDLLYEVKTTSKGTYKFIE